MGIGFMIECVVCVMQLALPEDRVWQAVLCWAKHNASIALDKNPLALTETEKERIQEVRGVVDNDSGKCLSWY